MEMVEEERTLERRLRVALDDNQFRLHYQPQLEQRTGRIVGAEALLRWHDPQCGLLAPGHFLAALESTGLIVPVGEWVLKQVTEDCQRWQRLGLPRLRLGINVSPMHLGQRNVHSRLLDTAALRACCELQVEISGSDIIEASAEVLKTLQTLRFEGVDVAVQDFGTNESVRGRLWALPVDSLKIARSFIQRITTDPETEIAVSSMLILARAFRLGIVAEGVETQEQFDLLVTLGCKETQGFLHSPPLPVAQFESLLIADAGVEFQLAMN